MSVINQMLNGLDERGVRLDAGEIRPVRTGRRRVKWALLIVTLLAVPTWFFLRPRVPPVPVVVPVPAAPLFVAASAVVPIPVVEKNIPEPVAKAQVVKPASEKIPAVATAKSSAASPDALRVPPVKTAQRVPDAKKLLPAMKNPSAPAMPSTPVIKEVSSAQAADAEYRRALQYAQQGKISEALGGLEAALHLDAGHDAARQAMVALLLEGRRSREAEQVLQEGLLVKSANSGFAMLLARLQIQRNELDAALATLEKTLAAAGSQAEYQAFYAALLQRKGRHEEALDHYRVALKSSPNNGLWLMGCGISSQALARGAEAKGFFQRALEVKTLSPELQVFVQQKLAALNGQ